MDYFGLAGLGSFELDPGLSDELAVDFAVDTFEVADWDYFVGVDE